MYISVRDLYKQNSKVNKTKEPDTGMFAEEGEEDERINIDILYHAHML
jgi:hypothetical protein